MIIILLKLSAICAQRGGSTVLRMGMALVRGVQMMMMIFIGTLFCNLHRDANDEVYLKITTE